MLLHRFAVCVAAATALLIFAGGLVTSTGSGLSVPDWPNTYGWFMFTFPLDKMVGGIYYEHGHRLIASTVGLLIVVLAAWLWRVEPRTWVRRLGFLALATVIAQGILGGITVLWFLPDPISIAHASLAQLVFCLTISIALVTSPGWNRSYVSQSNVHPGGSAFPPTLPQVPPELRRGLAGARLRAKAGGGTRPTGDGVLEKLAVATTTWLYVQILIGATMRHTDAGLAIPDFPLAFGHLIPPRWDGGIAIHFAHRVGAVIATILAAATVARVFARHHGRREWSRPAVLLSGVLLIQVTLGGLTVLSHKQYIINSLHVVTGAVLLATSLVLTLRAHRA